MDNEVFVILFNDDNDDYEGWHETRVVGVCSTEDLAKKKIRELGKTLEENRDNDDDCCITWTEDGLRVERDDGYGYRQSFYAIKYKVDYFKDSPS